MRPICSTLSVPAAIAAMANMPYGVSCTTKRVARRDERVGHREHVEQHLLALEADQRDAEDHREQHDGRHDVVGERVERVGRDVEIDEVEGRPLLDERRAEERRVSRTGNASGKSEREHQRDEPTGRPARRRPAARAAWPVASSVPRLAMIETVTYGSTVICSSLTKPSATTFSGATSSPRNSPTTMPAPRPARIFVEEVIRGRVHGR